MNTIDIQALRERLNQHKGLWAAIAREGEFDYSWVLRFADGRICEPRMGRLTKLAEILDRLPPPPGTPIQ